VGLLWAVACGFLRLVTHPGILETPLAPGAALDRLDGWMEQENVVVLDPGPRHLRILREILGAAGVAGSLTTDAHIAAVAIEHRAEVHSNDRDFERFPGLRLRNPLA
jgi:toxin-antitoxin system PIN domain toxin